MSRPRRAPREPDPDLVMELGPDKLAVFAEALVEHCLRLRVDIIDLQSVHYTVASALHAVGIARTEAVARARVLVHRVLLRLAADDSSYLPEDGDGAFADVLAFDPSARGDTVRSA